MLEASWISYTMSYLSTVYFYLLHFLFSSVGEFCYFVDSVDDEHIPSSGVH